MCRHFLCWSSNSLILSLQSVDEFLGGDLGVVWRSQEQAAGGKTWQWWRRRQSSRSEVKMTSVAAEFEHMEIQQQYNDGVNNRWDTDDWDNENSSARLFERSRIKALAGRRRRDQTENGWDLMRGDWDTWGVNTSLVPALIKLKNNHFVCNAMLTWNI